jgi:hypothetical protein
MTSMERARAARTSAAVALVAAALTSLVAMSRSGSEPSPPPPCDDEPPSASLAKTNSKADDAKRLDGDEIKRCVPTTDATFVRYDFAKGKDGLAYLMNSDEPDSRAWLETLSDVRTSIVPILESVKVAPDSTITDPDDDRLSETELERLRVVLKDPIFSGINSASFRDVGSSAVTTCCGRGVYITSKDFYPPRNWRQQNVLYVLHELAHVAAGNPPQERAHNLEFFRILRVLTKEAEQLGKKVYDPAWFNWEYDKNLYNIGAWIGTKSWYDIAKKMLLNGYRWNNRTLEKGPDWPPNGTGALVGNFGSKV